jgi:prepilin signal peptidase PulO-like enzyme (type II secretory pathway)
MYLFVAGVFGAIVGSFLNALSFRFNTGRSVWRAMGGRSHCMHCSHQLSAIDLVPILSYLSLGGRCRYCHSWISIQYPLVEVTAALLAVGVYVAHPDPLGLVYWFTVWMTLLFVVVYDIRHTIIPWSCSLFLMALALGQLWFGDAGLWSYLAGPILATPLFLTSLVSWGRWMGWGDGALELSLGWLLGLSAGFTALVLAFWIGAGVGTILLAASRLGYLRYTIKSELPFAPFLVLGAAIAYFSHVDFFSSISLF